MMVALVIYCIASLASATAHDWPFFLATRIVAGLGTGAESAIVAPFLSEFVARRYRGAFTGSLAGFFSFGFVAAALLGYFVIPLAPNAWRVVMVITALPIVISSSVSCTAIVSRVISVVEKWVKMEIE